MKTSDEDKEMSLQCNESIDDTPLDESLDPDDLFNGIHFEDILCDYENNITLTDKPTTTNRPTDLPLAWQEKTLRRMKSRRQPTGTIDWIYNPTLTGVWQLCKYLQFTQQYIKCIDAYTTWDIAEGVLNAGKIYDTYVIRLGCSLTDTWWDKDAQIRQILRTIKRLKNADIRMTKYNRIKSLKGTKQPNIYVIADWLVTRDMMEHKDSPNMAIITGHIYNAAIRLEEQKYSAIEPMSWYAALSSHNLYGKSKIWGTNNYFSPVSGMKTNTINKL